MRTTDASFEFAPAFDVDTDQIGLRLSPLDPEFQYLISRPKLSAELAELRGPHPEPSSALLDGSARARRDRRIAQRALGATVRLRTLPVRPAAPGTATEREAA